MARNPFRKRSAIARILSLPTAAERAYIVALRRLFQEMHKRYFDHLEPELKHHALLVQDGSPKNTPPQGSITRVGMNLDNITPDTLADMRRATGPLFDRMAKQVKTANDRGQRLLGINYSDVGLGNKIAMAREANINLVEKGTKDFIEQVRALFTDPDTLGLTALELKDMLRERAEVSESRAELIARDQTLKLNRQISATRQQNAGVTKFWWSTSRDERVRDTHEVLEGKVFSWDDPPEEIDDINCRCAQIPITADEDDDYDEGDDYGG